MSKVSWACKERVDGDLVALSYISVTLWASGESVCHS